ncbi:DUF397 domain-containing protein [Micromonospora sp. NPDC050397]|uniref:DUF397 domain-containing protein n=1 Tax=Micromonospora sp. NPDC050397 TaxID=3364279 RepID=UPI00384C2EC9
MDSQWRKSTRSGGNGACVEARYVGHTAQVRDSKDKTGPALAFSADAWMAFTRGIKTDA